MMYFSNLAVAKRTHKYCVKNFILIPLCVRISGLVVEYIVAIDVTRVRFPADARNFVDSSKNCIFGGFSKLGEQGI